MEQNMKVFTYWLLVICVFIFVIGIAFGCATRSCSVNQALQGLC